MNKKKFYGLDASDIEMLIRARDYLDSLAYQILKRRDELENMPDEVFEPYYKDKYRKICEARSHIITALDKVEDVMEDLEEPET